MTKQREAAGDWRAATFVAAGLLAAAGVLATPHPVAAQYRSNNDGRALDANSRAGSGGQNEASPTATGRGAVSGNQIITGNVTAGRQFRGVVPYSDPGAFRGITSGSFSSDRFVRESAGTPTRFGANVDLTQPMAYYGSGRAAPPPVGYLPTAGATGGYVGADPMGSGAQPNVTLSRAYTPTLDPTFRTSELIMSAQDAANHDSMLSASPLYGVRVWRAGESPNDFLAGDRSAQANGPENGQPNGPDNGQPGQTNNGQPNGQNNGQGQTTPDRGDRFRDANSILRMREELNRAAAGNDNGQNQGQNGNDQNGQQGTDTNGPGVGATGLQRSLNQSINQTGAGRGQEAGGTVAAGALNSTIGGNNNPLQNSVATGQSIQQRLVVSPERQTPELARLRRAYERQQNGSDLTDIQAARQFNRELVAQRQRPAQENQQPGQPGQQPGGADAGKGAVPSGPGKVKVAPPPDETPATAPDATSPQGQQPAAPAGAPAPAPEPEKVGSIAEGVQAKGLHDVLTSAEELMRSQKFSEALQKYDVAQQVAPNNALITMGRANAELAASYYRRAEMSLRDAVSRSPELVVAQFDLRSLIGQERLQVLVRDLKELSANDPKQARAPLLLAYIAYNTGNEAQAGEYLATAEQRAGADDPLIHAWRKNWKLPPAGTTESAPPPPDGNK